MIQPEKSREKCLHIYFEGRVQGVGFRYTCRYLANSHNIKGWVMNLPDGRVELLAQGEEEDLNAFIRDLKNEFLNYITNIKIEELTSQSHLKRFEIKFYLT